MAAHANVTTLRRLARSSIHECVTNRRSFAVAGRSRSPAARGLRARRCVAGAGARGDASRDAAGSRERARGCARHRLVQGRRRRRVQVGARRLTSRCCCTGARSGARPASSSSPRCSTVRTSSRSRSCSSPCTSTAICPTRRSGATCSASRAIPRWSCSSPIAAEITRIAGNMDLSLYAARARRCAGRRAPGQGRGRARRARPTRRWPPADCRRLAYHAFDLEDEGVFEAAQLAGRVRERRAAVPRGARQGTRALSHPGGRRGGRAAEGCDREGRQGRQAAHRAHPARQRVAGEQGARHGECRRLRGLPKEFYLAARQTVPQVAPDAARARDGRRRRGHRQSAIRAGRPARRAAHEDPRREGVCARWQGAHRRAQRGAADGHEDAGREAGCRTCAPAS